MDSYQRRDLLILRSAPDYCTYLTGLCAPYVQGAEVLEVGAGLGDLGRQLLKFEPQMLTLLEPSEECYREISTFYMGNHMSENIFTLREKCPLCDSIDIKNLFSSSFKDERFKLFINLEPTYGEIFKEDYNKGLLDGQNFIVAKCNNCEFVFQKNILNDKGMSKLYDEWIDQETARISRKKNN